MFLTTVPGEESKPRRTALLTPSFGRIWQVARSRNFELTCTAFVRRGDLLASSIVL